MLINDTTNVASLSLGYSRGLVPRDYAANPIGYQSFAPGFPDELLIPESEWEPRLAEQKAKGARILDVTRHIPVLDQDGYGYCWAFSSTRAVMLLRALQNQENVALSAWAVAAIIKNYRDEGGWGAESLEWIVKNGVPSLAIWPQGKVQRSLDTPEMRADAAKRKVTEWWDGSDNRDKAKRQLVTCLLLGIPCVTDFNWWSHSVCTHSLESIDPFVTWIDNSWSPGWGDNGRGKLEGSRAIPDGLVMPRVTMAGG